MEEEEEEEECGESHFLVWVVVSLWFGFFLREREREKE